MPLRPRPLGQQPVGQVAAPAPNPFCPIPSNETCSAGYGSGETVAAVSACSPTRAGSVGVCPAATSAAYQGKRQQARCSFRSASRYSARRREWPAADMDSRCGGSAPDTEHGGRRLRACDPCSCHPQSPVVDRRVRHGPDLHRSKKPDLRQRNSRLHPSFNFNLDFRGGRTREVPVQVNSPARRRKTR